MPEPIFEIDGLTKIYHTGDVEIRALSDVKLTLNEGELAVLLGPSGSGKSTLLNIVGGLDTASSGTVRFRDRDITAYNDRQLTQYRPK